MQKPLSWKICRNARQSFHIQLIEDADFGAVGAFVRRPPDYASVRYYEKGTPAFCRFRRMYQASMMFLDDSSLAA